MTVTPTPSPVPVIPCSGHTFTDPSWACADPGNENCGPFDPFNYALCEDNAGDYSYQEQTGDYKATVSGPNANTGIYRYVRCVENRAETALTYINSEITDATLIDLNNFVINTVIPQAGENQISYGGTALTEMDGGVDYPQNDSIQASSDLTGWESDANVTYSQTENGYELPLMGNAIYIAENQCPQ